jgi:hypothetical protein
MGLGIGDPGGEREMHCMKFPDILSIVEQARLTVRISMGQKASKFFQKIFVIFEQWYDLTVKLVHRPWRRLPDVEKVVELIPSDLILRQPALL